MQLSLHKRIGLIALAIVGTLALIALGGPTPRAAADVDPAGCENFSPSDLDPTIPTFKQFADANAIPNNTLGGTATGTTNRHLTANLNDYMDALSAATAGNPRVKMITRQIGTSFLGRPMRYAIIGTPDNINNLDSGRNDGAFWRGVREGTVSEEEGVAQAQDRPAFIWLTATPHGNEPAAGEALSRLAYELAARQDCHNLQRLNNLDTFIQVVTNPDGRDNNVRTTAFGFDPNRDFASRNQDVNLYRGNEIFKYPGPIYVDAHQQGSGYFFPPNEDAVHHEVSNFSWQFIQNTIGPDLQKKFNDQTGQYRNYNSYDLFAMVYGDSVPSVQLGAAGMTYEKGSSENYGKQVYDHYLALDETANIVSRDKADIMADWAAQWEEAKQQGEQGLLPQNHLVSPLNPTIIDQPPAGPSVFGYYYLPNNHSGDEAKLMRELLVTGVHVYKLDAPVNVQAHTFGPNGYTDNQGQTLPAGTLWIPSGQAPKHWIQAILGEDPFMPVAYHYDVVNWSWSLSRGMSGNGYLTQAMPGSATMTEITTPDLGGVTNGAAPVLAFPTDSASGLAMVVDLATKGVTVARSEVAFDSGGIHYPTGTALVDASTLGAVNIAQESQDRQTPVVGLNAYPVSRKQLATPKIGLYTGAATIPSNPLQKGAGTGQCSGSYCEALSVLSGSPQGLKFPTDTVSPDPPNPNAIIHPITSTDLTNNVLATQNYTAFINPSFTIAAGTGLTNLQSWVNVNGGNYVGVGANGLTTARNAGFTTSNTTPTNTAPFNDTTCPTASSNAFDTPGVFFMGDFDETDPVSWGFDNDGFIYRDSNGNPVWDMATIQPTDKVAAKYATPGGAFGYNCNADHVNGGNFADPTPSQRPELPGRPAIIDQTIGAGHASELGFNAFYRGWNDIAWRSVLNGALYPNSAPIAPGPKKVSHPTAPVHKPAKLAAVKNRPIVKTHDAMAKDIIITDATGHMKGLHRILDRANAPAKVMRKASFSRHGGSATLTVRGVRIADQELRPKWMLELAQNARDAGYLTNS